MSLELMSLILIGGLVIFLALGVEVFAAVGIMAAIGLLFLVGVLPSPPCLIENPGTSHE